MLQVLVTTFELFRKDCGICLKVDILPGLPTLRHSREKAAVKAGIARFEELAAEYQRRLESFFLQEISAGDRFSYRDETFVFRYASGGVLPILDWNSHCYFCLFYRDIDPVGWNIANGGTDTAEELLDPRITIEREFCEELLILDPPGRQMYRFDCEGTDAAIGAKARNYWRSVFENRQESVIEQGELKINWLHGPDSLIVGLGHRRHVVTECFVNINALDFGIEIDRIAEIAVQGKVVVCDGEVLQAHNINRPVGLFAVERVHKHLAAGAAWFEPDILFYDGVQEDASRLDELIRDRFLANQFRIRTAQEQAFYRSVCDRRLQYDLCPATKNIVRRLALRGRPYLKR